MKIIRDKTLHRLLGKELERGLGLGWHLGVTYAQKTITSPSVIREAELIVERYKGGAK